MKMYKALVQDKKTKEWTTIESKYPTKADFIRDLKKNGYSVNPKKVKPRWIFEYIEANTNMEERVWDKY